MSFGSLFYFLQLLTYTNLFYDDKASRTLMTMTPESAFSAPARKCFLLPHERLPIDLRSTPIWKDF